MFSRKRVRIIVSKSQIEHYRQNTPVINFSFRVNKPLNHIFPVRWLREFIEKQEQINTTRVSKYKTYEYWQKDTRTFVIARHNICSKSIIDFPCSITCSIINGYTLVFSNSDNLSKKLNRPPFVDILFYVIFGGYIESMLLVFLNSIVVELDSNKNTYVLFKY